MEVEAKLDKHGRGIMADDLWAFFCAAGCIPACHICHRDIKVDNYFRLKNYAKKNNEHLTASVMICDNCDSINAKLPFSEAEKLIERSGLGKSDIDWTKVSLTKMYRLNRKNEPVHVYHGATCGCFMVDGKIIV